MKPSLIGTVEGSGICRVGVVRRKGDTTDTTVKDRKVTFSGGVYPYRRSDKLQTQGVLLSTK